jgi:hypothetical protein
MTYIFKICALCVLFLPNLGSGQEWPAEGERIRVTRLDGTRVTGILSSTSGEELVVFAGLLRPHEKIPFLRIRSIETVVGKRRRFWRNFAIVEAATTIAGGLFGALTWSPDDTRLLAPANRGVSAGVGAVIGATFGAPLAILTGLFNKDEEWALFPFRTPGLPSIQIKSFSAGGHGLHFAFSIKAFF